MTLPGQLPDEAIRLSRLQDYRILDTPAEAVYDRIARLAALTMGTPMVAIGFFDSDRIWYKARIGIPYTAARLETSICVSLLTSPGPIIVPDTLLDPVVQHSPMVRGAPHLRFYLGIPLHSVDGVRIGSLAVFDRIPHATPTPQQSATLQELASQVTAELEQRRLAEEARAMQVPALTPGATTEKDNERNTAGLHRNLLAAYAAKSEFLASLSHELRTPLNAIVGYAGLIAGSDDAVPATAEHAAEINSAARHMLALVNDILEYSRLEAGTVQIGWQRVTLAPIVEDTLRMVRVFATSRNVQLASDITWPDALVRADPVRIKQVLLNLLTNAIKFTPEDGAVTVSLAPAPNDSVELVVRDTGIGIAESDIAKVLIPFGQIVPKEGVPTEGTGLGLPIAKSLVERQGGTLSMESRIGQGTTVRILMPALVRYAAPSEAPAAEPELPSPTPSRRRA